MSRTRALLTDGIIYTIGDLLTVGVSGFLLIPVYVRAMSTAEYGVYGAVMAAVAVASAAVQLGFLSALARYYYIHQNSGEQDAYLTTVVVFQTTVAIAFSLLAWGGGSGSWHVILPTVPYEGYAAVVVLSAATAFLSGLYPQWLRVHNRARAFVAVQTLGTVVLCVCVWWFVIARRGGALGAVLAGAVQNVVMCVVTIVALRSHFRREIRWRFVKGTLNFGFWTMVGTVGYLLLNRSQLFLLQRRLPMAEVGRFFLALQLAGVLAIVSTSFSKALQPTLYAAQVLPEASDVLRRFSRPYVVVLLYGSVSLMVFAHDILLWLSGRNDAATTAALRILTAGCLCYAASALPSSGLLYARRVVPVQLILFAALLVNVIGGALLAISFGMLGAAWAVVLGFAVLLFGNYLYAQRVIPVEYGVGTILRGVLCGGIAVSLALWSPEQGILGFSLRIGVMLIFTGLLFMLGVIHRGDLKALKALAAAPGRRLGLGY